MEQNLADCDHLQPFAAGLEWDHRIAVQLGVENLYRFQVEATQSWQKGKDVFVCVPTSGGKSFCYVIPTLLSQGLVLVICPLIALMRDQVYQLRKLGIGAAALDSLQSPEEKRQILTQLNRGELQILFVAPERLALPSFRSILSQLTLSLIAIDEAHCINQWGHDFRPDYLRIGKYLDQVSTCPRMALTATATREDRHLICRALGMKDPDCIQEVRPRENLKIRILKGQGVADHQSKLLQAVLNEEGSGIIYTATRRQADELVRVIKNAGISAVGIYHAGLEGGRRLAAQEAFQSDDLRIMVATKAFGMGINKHNIRFVFHASMPSSMESYVQEIGRAGRDGLPAKAYLFYGPRDYYVHRFMIQQSFPEPRSLKIVYEKLRDLFTERQAILEDHLGTLLNTDLTLKSNETQTVLDFLYRERILERLELSADSWMEGMPIQTMISWGQENLSIEKLLDDLEVRKEERMNRLRIIHQMVKSEQDPSHFIATYFQ